MHFARFALPLTFGRKYSRSKEKRKMCFYFVLCSLIRTFAEKFWNMETMTLPRQLLVTVDDSVDISNVTRAIKMLRGVTAIKRARNTTKKACLYDPETGECLNEKTMSVIEDARQGKNLVTYSSFEEFEKAMRGL